VGADHSEDGQIRMMMKMLVEQAKAQDKFFKQTGVEEEQLNYLIHKLNLQADPEF